MDKKQPQVDLKKIKTIKTKNAHKEKRHTADQTNHKET